VNFGAAAFVANAAGFGALALIATHRLTKLRLKVGELTQVLDSATIAVTDASGTISHWSQGCERLYGWQSSEALGRKKYDLLQSESDIPGWDPNTVSRDSLEVELVETCRDGSKITVLQKTQVVERSKHEPLFVFKMIDISERASSAALLRVSETRLAIAMETSQIAVAQMDLRTGLILWSPGSEQRLGFKEGALSSFKDWQALVHPDDAQNISEALSRAASSRSDRFTYYYRYIQPGGDTRTIEGTARCFYSDAGELTTLIGANLDVTERDAADQRMRELDNELALLSRQTAMGALAADLAHEINQPLSATSNYLATARLLTERGGKTEHVINAIAMSEQQVLRAGEIIRRLRDFLSRHEVQKGTHSLEHTLREAVDLVLFGAARLEVDICFQLDPDTDQVFIDRIQVQQVMVNLVRNALEAFDNYPQFKREIVISSRPLGPAFVEISVADNGPGLPENVDRGFNPRFESEKGAGSMGVGLSISKRIIEAHGGTLSAENRQEGGAKFSFSLPMLGG
jgi:two-component system sensor kinase FixL